MYYIYDKRLLYFWLIFKTFMVSITFVHANASNGRSRGPGSSPRSDRQLEL